MFNFKLFLTLVVAHFGSIESIEVDCGIKKNAKNQKFFKDLEQHLYSSSQACVFKIDESKNSSEINFEFPVSKNTNHLTFIYTTTSIPILPAELFRKFPNKTLSCGFYKLPMAIIERDWFQYSGNLKHLFFCKNKIPKLEGGKFFDLKNFIH
jgi:hypothetical protein